MIKIKDSIKCASWSYTIKNKYKKLIGWVYGVVGRRWLSAKHRTRRVPPAKNGGMKIEFDLNWLNVKWHTWAAPRICCSQMPPAFRCTCCTVSTTIDWDFYWIVSHYIAFRVGKWNSECSQYEAMIHKSLFKGFTSIALLLSSNFDSFFLFIGQRTFVFFV